MFGMPDPEQEQRNLQVVNDTLMAPPITPEERTQMNPLLTESNDLYRGIYGSYKSLKSGELHRQSMQAEAEDDFGNAKALRQRAQQYEAEAAQVQPRINSYDQVQNIGDAADFLQGGLGQLVPTMIPPIAAGGAGSLIGAGIGSLIAPGPGTAAGAAIGGAAGAFIPSFFMNAEEQASAQAANPDIMALPPEQRLHEQNVVGVQNALLDVALPGALFGRVVGRSARKIAGEALAQSPLRRTAAFARETLLEAGTEGLQAKTGQMALSRLDPNRDTSQDYVETINSIILGGLGGGTMSLGTTVPGYLMERAGNRAKQEGDIALQDVGRAVGEVQLRMLQEEGIDVPLGSLKPSLMLPDLDPGKKGKDRVESRKLEKLAVEWQQAVTVYGEDHPIAQERLDKAKNFFRMRGFTTDSFFPSFEQQDTNLLDPGNVDPQRGKDTLRLNDEGAPTVEDQGMNMMPESDTTMLPGLGKKASNPAYMRHVLNDKDEQKSQLKKWTDQKFITPEAAKAAKFVPVGDRLKQFGYSPEEMRTEANDMIRDLDARATANEKRGRTELAKGQRAEIEALKSAKSPEQLVTALNEYSVASFPPGTLEDNFTPEDADAQRRSWNTLTSAKDRKALETSDGIWVRLTNGQKRLLIKQDVIKHAYNFFREDLGDKNTPQNALLAGIFADPRVKGIIDPETGTLIQEPWRQLENPRTRASLKLPPLETDKNKIRLQVRQDPLSDETDTLPSMAEAVQKATLPKDATEEQQAIAEEGREEVAQLRARGRRQDAQTTRLEMERGPLSADDTTSQPDQLLRSPKVTAERKKLLTRLDRLQKLRRQGTESMQKLMEKRAEAEAALSQAEKIKEAQPENRVAIGRVEILADRLDSLDTALAAQATKLDKDISSVEAALRRQGPLTNITTEESYDPDQVDIVKRQKAMAELRRAETKAEKTGDYGPVYAAEKKIRRTFEETTGESLETKGGLDRTHPSNLERLRRYLAGETADKTKLDKVNQKAKPHNYEVDSLGYLSKKKDKRKRVPVKSKAERKRVPVKGAEPKSGPTNYFDLFQDYVKRGQYSAFVRDLLETKSAAEVKQINRGIRELHVLQLGQAHPELGELTFGVNNSTIRAENDALLRKAIPTFSRLMVGNHGIYIEFTEPADKGTFVKKHLQYNEYNRNGQKLYDQFKAVNYADYKPGKWYVSIEEALSQPQSTTNPARTVTPSKGYVTRQQVARTKDTTVYLFGDNQERWGMGGQAAMARTKIGRAGVGSEIEGVIGIATKKSPSQFMTDAEFEANKASLDADFAKIPADKNVVIMPLGEGRAELKAKAPKTYAYLQQKIAELKGQEVSRETSKVQLPQKTRYAAKDQAKSDQATKFIGRGSANSSTAAYAQAWGDKANSGEYAAEDKVFVSVEGNRTGRMGVNRAELQRAIDAGATIITDDKANRSRPYNVGEREVAAFLAEKGYTETKPGIWQKAAPVRESTATQPQPTPIQERTEAPKTISRLLAARATPMAMNFRDGTRGLTMRPEFRGKSTLDLIKSGDRTATTRHYDPNVRVGQILKMYNGNDYVFVRVTKAPYAVQDVTAEQWSKLEGWAPENYAKYANMSAVSQFQYELVQVGSSTTPVRAPTVTQPQPTPTAKPTVNIASPYKGRAKAQLDRGVSQEDVNLAAALTNVTFGKWQVDDVPGLTRPDPNGQHKLSAEAWYFANRSAPTEAHYGRLNEDMAVMQKIIEAKLRQYPRLMKALEDRGGVTWIENAEHTVTGRGRWEGKGRDSNFLDVLAKAYESVLRTPQAEAKPTPTATPSAEPVDTTKPFKEWANPGQVAAYDAATAYLDNPSMTTFSITGSAGTGKTTLVKEIIKTVKGKRIVLSSPTHRANSVIRTQNPDGDIMTLHKLLGLKPFVDLTDFDASDLKFVEEGEIEMPYRGILLIDESSMIGDALYGLLIRTASQYGTKIMFLGDMAQLGPVGQETDSRALTNSDAMADLVQVMRAKNAELLDESVHVREKGTFSGKSNMDKNNNGVKFTGDRLAFIKRAIAFFKSDEFKKNPLLVRVLPFLNDTVVLHNNEIREGLFGADAPAFVKGELLMGYAAFSKGRNKPILVQNGIDYIADKVGAPRQSTLFDVPVTVYDATIRDVYSGETKIISLADPNTPISAQRQINQNASPLKRQAAGNRSIWPTRIYPQLQQFAIPFDIVTDDGKTLSKKHFHYGYSHTIHKSQGGTYKYVMVNDNDITSAQRPDEKTKSRLRYVGVTRAEHGAFVLSRKGGIKPALAGVAQDQRFETLEEAQADPGVLESMDKATKWLIRAFGPEIRQHMGWMLAREAPGRPMEGYYIYDDEHGVVRDFISLAADAVDPLGTAFHEGMHKFVKQLGLTGNQDLYQRLVKAATAPHVMKQMERLLRELPSGYLAIDQIRTDPEEAVAYAFQLYAASRIPGGPEFHLMNKKLFMRVIDTIKKMLGLMTNSNAAEHIFAALFEGRVNRDGIVSLKKYQERAFKEYAKDVMTVLRESVPRSLSSPIIQLQRMRNADGELIGAFKKLANYWHSEPLKGGKSGLIYRDSQTEGQFRNRWYKVVQDNNMTKEDLKSALLNFQSMKPPRTQFEKDLTHFLNRMWVYQFGGDESTNPVKVLKEVDAETGRKAWVTPGQVKNYFSRIWSIENILANEIEFREVMAEEGNLDEATITNFIEMLQATNGVEAGAELQQYRAEFSPFNAAINARAFEFIKEGNAHRFAKFQEQDMGKIMERYIRQAVHRREHSRTFGHDGKVIEELFAEARREGASPEQIAYAEKVVKGLEGRLGTDKVSDLQREIMVGSMSVTNIAVLALALFSSMVDPLGVLVRTGSVTAAGKTFVAGFRQILADARKVKVTDQEITEYLGIIEEDMAQDLLNNMERGIYMNEKLRKVNKFFFKSIGLEQWTRGTRIGATRAVFEYLKKNADNAAALEELGLTPDQIERFGDRIKLKPEEFKTGEEITDADIEKARLVQNAVYRMVDEAILRPSAASRPLWMSDMRFKLLGHLKSYTFTFHNQILRQLGTRAANAENMAQAALVFAPLLTYVPVMLAADMARGLIQGDDKDRDWDELLGRAFQRSAVAGMGTFFLDAKDEMDWGGLPTNTLLGPVIDTALNLGQAATNPDSSVVAASAKLLPYNALWRKWGEDD